MLKEEGEGWLIAVAGTSLPFLLSPSTAPTCLAPARTCPKTLLPEEVPLLSLDPAKQFEGTDVGLAQSFSFDKAENAPATGKAPRSANHGVLYRAFAAGFLLRGRKQFQQAGK